MAGGDTHTEPEQNEPAWQYRPEGTADKRTKKMTALAQADTPGTTDDGSIVNWTASEFIAHAKGISWYVGLGAAIVIVCAFVYLLARDVVSVVAISVLGILVGVSGAKKPRIMEYRLDRSGLTVGTRFYPYGNFKSFAIVQEGAFASVMLLPIKRLALPVGVYFSPDDQAQILTVLSKRLPAQPGELGIGDHLMTLLHF